MELYVPQEERLLVQTRRQALTFGVPRESVWNENRVALTPEGVDLLVSRGHRVLVETGAGEMARYSDASYADAGAELVYDSQTVFGCPWVVKVQPPTLEELAWMAPGATLVSALQPSSLRKELVVALMHKRITALAYEHVEDGHQQKPFVRSMGEIAGSTAILLAADYLSTTLNGRGYVMGGVTGVPPTDVVILGAGMVGTVAARVARGMGAHVRVFDRSLTRLHRLQSQIDSSVHTVVLQPRLLEKALMECDVAIGALRADKGRTPVVVTEATVSRMKPGSIVVDVSIDQGGCFETSEITSWQSPSFERFGVLHIGIPNLAARTARTASFALNNLTAPLLDRWSEAGGWEGIVEQYPGVARGLYVFGGHLVSQPLGERFDLPYSEIGLLV